MKLLIENVKQVLAYIERERAERNTMLFGEIFRESLRTLAREAFDPTGFKGECIFIYFYLYT
jgi:hypothetical protein